MVPAHKHANAQTTKTSFPPKSPASQAQDSVEGGSLLVDDDSTFCCRIIRRRFRDQCETNENIVDPARPKIKNTRGGPCRKENERFFRPYGQVHAAGDDGRVNLDILATVCECGTVQSAFCWEEGPGKGVGRWRKSPRLLSWEERGERGGERGRGNGENGSAQSGERKVPAMWRLACSSPPSTPGDGGGGGEGAHSMRAWEGAVQAVQGIAVQEEARQR
jgi:hypothetical protein